MDPVTVAVEGDTDVPVVEKILSSRSLVMGPVFGRQGKGDLDRRMAAYNKAARHRPWFTLRDSDHDAGDCPARLRASLLDVPKSEALCLRFAVRTIEAWLLADREAFAATFGVPSARIPVSPEQLDRPKHELIRLCRDSRRTDVRKGMAPPPSARRDVGPEYTAFIGAYCRDAWRPDVAAQDAPSLARALNELDRLLATKAWG